MERLSYGLCRKSRAPVQPYISSQDHVRSLMMKTKTKTQEVPRIMFNVYRIEFTLCVNIYRLKCPLARDTHSKTYKDKIEYLKEYLKDPTYAIFVESRRLKYISKEEFNRSRNLFLELAFLFRYTMFYLLPDYSAVSQIGP